MLSVWAMCPAMRCGWEAMNGCTGPVHRNRCTQAPAYEAPRTISWSADTCTRARPRSLSGKGYPYFVYLPHVGARMRICMPPRLQGQ